MGSSHKPVNAVKGKQGFQKTGIHPVTPTPVGDALLGFEGLMTDLQQPGKATGLADLEKMAEILHSREHTQLTLFDMQPNENPLVDEPAPYSTVKMRERWNRQTALFGGSEPEWHEYICCDFLRRKYGKALGLTFETTKVSDSSKSDILVSKDTQGLFYVEVKMPDAQSGQFVLVQEDGSFSWSTRNKSHASALTQEIITHINGNYDRYKDVDSNPIPLELEEEAYAQWIVNYYKSKNAAFFMTHRDNEPFLIIPVDRFSEYFTSTAVLRKKPSGSRQLPKSLEDASRTAMTEALGFTPPAYDRTQDGKNAWFRSTQRILDTNGQPITSDGISFGSGAERFLVKPTGKINWYKVRKLSDTTSINPSIVYSVSLKPEAVQAVEDLLAFEKELHRAAGL